MDESAVAMILKTTGKEQNKALFYSLILSFLNQKFDDEIRPGIR